MTWSQLVGSTSLVGMTSVRVLSRAIAVFFEKGSQWTITVGGTSRSGLSLSAGSVYATYGTGPKPLILLDSSDQKTTAMAGVQLGGNNLVDGLKIKGYAMIGFPVGSNGNIVQNCEVDGTIDGREAGTMQLGFSISGQHNLIVGNTVHDLAGLSGDTGNVNNFRTSRSLDVIELNLAARSVPLDLEVGVGLDCIPALARKNGRPDSPLVEDHDLCRFWRSGAVVEVDGSCLRKLQEGFSGSVIGGKQGRT